MDVHVDFTDQGDRYLINGQSDDGLYKIQGWHEKDVDGALDNVTRSVAKHNRESGTAYVFATYTFHPVKTSKRL